MRDVRTYISLSEEKFIDSKVSGAIHFTSGNFPLKKQKQNVDMRLQEKVHRILGVQNRQIKKQQQRCLRLRMSIYRRR